MLPRLLIPRRLLRCEPMGMSCHVTCHVTDAHGVVRMLYEGRAYCVVSDELKQEFCQPPTAYPPTSSDGWSTTAMGDFLMDNLFSQPSEGIQFDGLEFEPPQPCTSDGPYFDASSQPIVLTHTRTPCDLNNTAEVDMLASELLAQLPDLAAFSDSAQATEVPQTEYVSDGDALIEILSSDKQPATGDTLIFLDEVTSAPQDRVDDEVEKYMEESLDHISVPDTEPRRKHQCPRCDDSFTSLLKLRCHVRTSHVDPDDGSFICDKCNRKFNCRERWQSHRQAHADPNLECPKCTKVLGSKASLKAHMKIHERKHNCEYCARSYETEQQLKEHTQKKHTTFTCQRCRFSCRNERQLEEHLENHPVLESDFDEPFFRDHFGEFGSWKGNEECIDENNNNDCEDDEEINVDEVDELEDENLIVDDEIDYLVVGDFEKLEERILNIEEEVDFLQHEEYDIVGEGDVVDDFQVGNDVIFSELDKAYKQMLDIMQIESSNKKSRVKKKLVRDCDKCNKHFDRGSDFKRHVIEHVARETLRACDRERRRRQSSNAADHPGSPVFECRLCEKSHYTRLDKLKAHLRVHLKLRLYQCVRCHKTFSDSSNYSKHKKVHGLASYQCDICKRKFNTKKMIAQHMEYHKKTKPLACQYCTKVCYFESTLKKHINVHHKSRGNSAFSCQHCHQKFPSMKHKWDHQWRQHGIRKAVNDCQHCCAKFRKVSELKRHLKQFHRVVQKV